MLQQLKFHWNAEIGTTDWSLRSRMFRSMLQFTSLYSSKNENISKSTYHKSSLEDNPVIHARSKQTEKEAKQI